MSKTSQIEINCKKSNFFIIDIWFCWLNSVEKSNNSDVIFPTVSKFIQVSVKRGPFWDVHRESSINLSRILVHWLKKAFGCDTRMKTLNDWVHGECWSKQVSHERLKLSNHLTLMCWNKSWNESIHQKIKKNKNTKTMFGEKKTKHTIKQLARGSHRQDTARFTMQTSQVKEL